MSMLEMRDPEIQNDSMPVLRLAGFALGGVACVLYFAMAVLLGAYCWNMVGSVAASVVSAVVLVLCFGAVLLASKKIVRKTNGKFGKCRPFMVIGNVLMLLGGGIALGVTHRLPENAFLRAAFFVVFGLLFVSGLAVQTVAYLAGLGCLPQGKSSRVIFVVSVVVLFLAFGALTYVLGSGFAANGTAEMSFFTPAWNYLAWTGLAANVLAIVSIGGRDSYQYYKR